MDLACGSGAFLIGMFQVLDDLLARADMQLGIRQTSFERKKRIIVGSLRGIEAKSLAVQIARSRLWLQLMADSSHRKRKTASANLGPASWLPDLTSTVYCDDSLLPGGGVASGSLDGDLGARNRNARHRFDIVIGNPPYVRQELIRDPNHATGKGSSGGSCGYKARLARAVYAAWPKAFGYDAARDSSRCGLDSRSDLYIYFYLLGLSLLDDRGTLCFVSSNSWLDARYGRGLQEFLLTHGWLKLVIENQVRRSFDTAGVNTAIVLLGAAHDAETSLATSAQKTARFVTLSIPFEQAVSAAIWEAVAATTSRCQTPDYRVLARNQGDLVQSGTSLPQQRYVGEKWGANYLRAPHIYSVVREKYGDRMVRLGDSASVRRGITTGANDFFFLDEIDQARWGIEREFLLPALKGPRELDRVWLDVAEGVRGRIFVCPRDKAELRGTRALAYIEHGESMGYDQRPTCRRRTRWWDLGAREGARVHCSYMVDRVMRFWGSDTPYLASDGFQEIHAALEPEVMLAACSSTLGQLSANVLGRTNFGGGLLKMQTYELRDLLIPDPRTLGSEAGVVIRSAGLLGLQDPDRQTLDDIVSYAVGLTRGEQEAVREAVSGMVAARISKARSLASR
jgi:hypothetical protein